MKKKLFCALLTVMMVVSMLPAMPVSAAASITKDEIKNRADKYISALGIVKTDENYKICNVFWNKGIRSNDTSLCSDLDNFRATGNVAYLNNHISTKKCIGGEHSHPGTCTSNGFQLSYQCMGFARYFMYYLFGAKPKDNNTDYYTYQYTSTSWDSLGGLQIGDYVHFTTGNQKYHPVVYYGAEGGYLIAVHANGLASTYPCGIQYGKVYKNSGGFYTIDDIKSMYNSGSVYVIRYKNIITCSHTVNGESAYSYDKNQKVAVCSQCKSRYIVPALVENPAYMDVVSVNKKSGTAPAHDTPYGDADIGTRYEKGQTVYVRGTVTNAFGNTWYQLMTGEWLSGDYLGQHIHCWSSKGFCTHCTSSGENAEGKTTYYYPIWMGHVPMTTTKHEKTLIHFAPYGDSLVFDTIAPNSNITVDAKIVNGYKNEWYRIATGTYKGGWISQKYMNTYVFEYEVTGAITMRYGPGDVYDPVAYIPANGEVDIYPKEVSNENPNWYSARYGDIVGFIPKSSGSIMRGGKQVEISYVEEPAGKTVEGTPVSGGNSSSGGGSSSGGSSSGVTSVSVQYPDDPNYLAKKFIGETNATLVTNIQKPSGSRVTACGLRIYSSDGTLLKDHRETVTNVGNSVTDFHAWYDVQSELGLTLTPGTRYLYEFYAVINGITYNGGRYGFTTAGTAPALGPTQVYVFYPTEQTYLDKFFVTETNAGVAANVLKPAGTKVTACGLLLYDVNDKLIKDHRETVSNVGDTTTSFHIWYDIKEDLGLTLDPGTEYHYKIYAVVDGAAYEEGMYSFTTTGTAPAAPKQYTLTFDPNGGTCDTSSKTVTYAAKIGTLPAATRTGYTFKGWYIQKDSGGRIGDTTTYDASYDITVYAHWTANNYTLKFDPNGGTCATAGKQTTFDSQIGDMPVPTRDGYAFDGWYTQKTDGKKVNTTTRYNASYDVTVYARWTKVSAVAAMKDVSADAWYFNAVNYVVEHGLMSGYNATTFGSNDTLNRAMVVQVLYNKEGQPSLNGKKHSFKDVSSGQWFNNAVTWGNSRGVVGGFGGGLFKPEDAVTIEQMAVILWNYAKNPAVSGEVKGVGKYSDWAANALRWCANEGILNNVPFSNATEKATRAQTAQILTNFLNSEN